MTSVFQGRLHDFNVNYTGFQYVERVLSQKPGSGFVLTVFALKNPW